MAKIQQHYYICPEIFNPRSDAHVTHIVIKPDVDPLCHLSITEVSDIYACYASKLRRFKEDVPMCPKCEEKFKEFLVRRSKLISTW